jgi:non-ribosomal peptide synthetase component F/acyl carrier protein
MAGPQKPAASPLDWARSPLPEAPPGEQAAESVWLIFADALGLGARIAGKLAADGITASLVTPGPALARTGESAWTLPPGRREECLSLLTDLGALPAFVLHLWALSPEYSTPDLFTRLEQGQEAGFHSLLPLFWALSGPARVLVAADHMQRVLRGETVDPSRSSLPGLCAAVTAAQPGLSCRSVDLLPPTAGRKAWIESTAKLLIAEARYGIEPAVAYRGGERWEPVPDETPQTDLERALAEAWRELLGGPPVRRRDSFFERGGDSRSALLLAERLERKLGIELPVAELLTAPTVAGLAEAIEHRRRESLSPVSPVPSNPILTSPSPPAFPPLPVGGRAMGEGGQGGEVLKLAATPWRQLKERAGRHTVTPAGAVLAAFCDVLAVWSEAPRFAVAVDGAGLVEIDAAAPGGFGERARSIQEQLWKAAAVRTAGPTSWPVTFAFGPHPPGPPLPSPSLPPGEGEDRQQRVQCRAEESEGGLTVRWEASGLSGEMLSALRDHLHRLAGNETAWSDERRRLIPPQQLARRIHAGGSGAPLSRERLEALVAARAETARDRPAVAAPDRALSYGELLALSGRLGRALRDLGATPGTPVAIVLEPGWEAVASILGILTSGAAWVPVDPHLPPQLFQERLAEYLAATPGRPSLAVTSHRWDGLAWPPEAHRVFLSELAESGGEPFRTPPSAADLACVIPLPGSGGPMIEHRGLAPLILDLQRRFGVGPEDRFLAVSPLHHLPSLYEIFGPLIAGGTLVMPGAPPASWLETVHRERITVWVSEPEPLLGLLEESARTGLGLPFRRVLVSGRRLTFGLAERLRAACPGARSDRLTPVPEAPLWAAVAPLDAPPAVYGQPLAHLTLHVLDDRLEPRPDGVAGALHLGGAGLARGTWRAPVATAASFLLHPDTGERLFRTGETARAREDGTVEVVEEESL